MAAKVLCAIVFAVAVPAVFAITASEIGPCPFETGTSNFTLDMMCFKSFYGLFLSENSEKVSCAVGHVACPPGGPITINTKLIDENGVKIVDESAVLVDMGNGVVDRAIKTTAGVMHYTDIVVSFSQLYGGHTKVGYVICDRTSTNVGHVKAAFISTVKDADFTDDINAFNYKYNTISRLVAIPNGSGCLVKDYYQ